MMHFLSRNSMMCVLALAASGCVTSNEVADGVAMTACTEPRPQICTHEYRPVCATLAEGSTQTYATGCTACSDPKVTGFRNLACE